MYLCDSTESDYNPFVTQQPTEWSGTGWLLNKGYVVTNHHVADNARTIKVKFPKENGWDEYTAELAISNPDNDLAILRITSSDFNSKNSLPYALKTSKTSISDVAESVFVLGYPMITTMGEEIKLTASDTDYTDDCYVRFAPRWTGRFAIKIVNHGNVFNNYTIVTN